MIRFRSVPNPNPPKLDLDRDNIHRKIPLESIYGVNVVCAVLMSTSVLSFLLELAFRRYRGKKRRVSNRIIVVTIQEE